ncbi:TPA: hypothetical protein HMW42_00035 [Escherichia coli]|uniref:prophage tail fiber N-terminal domain-containing protein n=2 Tax=Escherichia coli TaxID=562 RepID=UPI0017537F1E|nr:prophage tail fiber N-terminal domain-containing protein [Escherichia coli]MCO4869282.1 prophage tail fiber N-terminal domain-containing protein [Escherichia coli]HAJ6334771.1 hypothetical protein [Escherichia coli]HAJ6365099.1 hypothetical protein [Escherichia coli]HBE4552154.1 prophage tail fiber N-terminal domain-containing protein [Escherichia coli]HBV0670874.1 prophage tail fiber N-terminal domain-containing protein [Escherichia coli]
MAVQISGILKDGTGKAVQNCTIELKAKRTSATVIVHTVASHDPDKAGHYSMAVEPGQYQVSLHVEGWPPSYAGSISVYQDSKPGTLNDFLGALTEDDLRPEALRHFEQMVDIVARQAEATAGDMQKAGQYAEEAGRLVTQAESLAGEVQQNATSVAESERNTRQLAETVAQRVGDAERAAEETRQNAAQAGQYAQQAQQNAGQTAQDVLSVTDARDAAVRAREGAESALAATVQQAGIATQQAEEAGSAANQATRQAELTATARNEAVSARDETAAFAREVKGAVSQINQKVTTATGAAERAENAAGTTATNAEQAAASADKAAEDREATQTLAQRAETAAGRAEEIAGAFNLEDASLEKKGITRLSSATDSDSETEAATPKAVKAVMDETNGKAPLDSPALTGTPTAPTAEQSVNNTQIATTAFVKAAIAAMVASAPAALDTLNELATALGNDPQFATTMLNALAGKQPLDEQLTAFSQLDATQNTFPYFDSNSQLSLANVSEAARTLLALTSKEAIQEHLGAGQKGGGAGQLVEILGSGTSKEPEVGGLILAAYVGEMGSDLKKTTIKRGDDYPGSALTVVDISMREKTATSLWVDTLMFGLLPGTYRALSGTGFFEEDGKYALGLFIRKR